jgi:hypothetical protein
MSTLLYPIFTVAQLTLLIAGLRLYARRKTMSLLFVIVIAAGLVYDNLIIAVGAAVGVGGLLEALSFPRFLIHALCTPLLLMAGYEMAHNAGVQWFDHAMRRRTAWIVTFVLIGIGFWQSILGVDLKPACHDGTLRYAERVSESQLCANVEYTQAELNERGLPPIASIITIVLVGLEGLAIGRKVGWWVLCIGAIVMFVGAAVPASRVGPLVANGAEVILVACALATEFYLDKRGRLATENPILKTV